jgi:folate-binding protein YgfZ
MPSTPLLLHDTHAASGAVFSERDGRELVAHYGDVSGEYEAALDGSALIDLAERGVLVASGPKRQDFLQGMVSNDVGGRQPGEGCRAAMMNARGHIRYLLRLLVEKDAVRVETDADRLEGLLKDLELYRVAAPVRFALEPTAILALFGVAAPETLRALVTEPPGSPGAHFRAAVDGHPVLVARAGDLPGGGFVLHVAPEEVAAVWGALAAAGARPVGRDALDARRVEDLRPWYGQDITGENLLHETGLLGELHSSTKGCYVGQEVVARLEARGGNVNKALRRLRLSAPAAAGTAVLADEKEIGHVSTSARSPRFGPLALAWVHRNHFEPGTELSVDGSPATVMASFEEE